LREFEVLRVSETLHILLHSKALENGTAESSDEINVSDIPVVFLEDV
jgi:hypothetical protein